MKLLHNSKLPVKIGAFLFKIGYLDIAVPAHKSLMRKLLLDYSEERGFSDAVVADNADFFSSADIEAEFFDKSFP